MLLYFSIIFFLYYLFVLILILGWVKIPSPGFGQNSESKAHFVSIVVAVRNEEKNIHNLMYSLCAQTYPKDLFEVIVIDDLSEDDTAKMVKDFKLNSSMDINLICMKGEEKLDISPKKLALAKGIAAAKGEIILTTDGDCWMNKDWLASMVRPFVQENIQFISGPLNIHPGQKLWSKIQSMEFASLIGSGASMISLNYPLMCNGANLAFRKRAFMEVGGYAGKYQYASGDDVHLMHKINDRFPNAISFNKDRAATVSTYPARSFRLLISQRQRWASKWRSYKLVMSWSIPVFLFIYYMSFIALIITSILYPSMIASGAVLIGMKFIIDFIFLKMIMNFCNLQMRFFTFFLCGLLYPFYAIAIGILAHFGNWSWKGRKYER